MSKARKLLVIMLIVTILTPLLPAKITWAAETKNDYKNDYSDIDYNSPEQQERFKYFYKYVTTYVEQATAHDYVIYDKHNGYGYHGAYHQNEWPINKIGSRGTKASGPYSNKIVVVCCVFTASMLHQAWGVDIVPAADPGATPYYDDPQSGEPGFYINAASYSDPNGNGKGIFYQVKNDEPMYPGDVLRMSGHSAIYIGKDPETGKHMMAETGGTHAIWIRQIPNSANRDFITPQFLHDTHFATGDCNFIAAHRLLPEKALENWSGVPSEIRIQWPDGSTTYVDPDDLSAVEVIYDESAPLYYSGIATPVGSFGTQDRLKELIKGVFEFFKNILKFAIGIPALVLRMPFVGWAHLLEVVVGSATQVMSSDGSDKNMTLEKIIFNRVPLFDINIFNFEEAGGSPLTTETEGENVIILIRNNIAQWYVAFRNLVIVVLFVILIYLGIRMAITSIAEEKANYKRMLVDWFVSFVIVMFIHFFLIIILALNDHLVNTLYGVNSMDSLYEEIKLEAYTSIEFTKGWYATIMYIALVWYMVKYAWKYAKRMLSGYILIMLSPLVAISYALDKIKDNKAQSLGKWMKEVLYTVLIQTAHCLIYVTFVSGIIGSIVRTEDSVFKMVGVTIFLIIAIKFMDTAENIFKNIFGFESSSILKEVMSTSFEMFAKMTLARKVLRGYFAIGKKGLKLTGKTIKFAGKGVGLVATPVGKGLTKLSYKVAPNATANMRDFKNRRLDRFNSMVDSLAGVQMDKSQATMSNVKQLINKYESGRFNDPYGYSARAKKIYGLEKQVASNLLQGGHFILDEGTSAVSGAAKLLVAGMAGASLARVLRREARRGEKRTVKAPKVYGTYDENTGELSKIDKRYYSAPKGLRARFREIILYNRGERLLRTYLNADAELTRATDKLHIGAALGNNATEAEIMQAEKNAFGFVVEAARRPSEASILEGAINAREIELWQGPNITMATVDDAFIMVEKTIRTQSLSDVTKGTRTQKTETIPSKEIDAFIKNKSLGEKYKKGIEDFVVTALLEKDKGKELSISPELKTKFMATENEAREKAKLLHYNKDKTEKLVETALKEEVQKTVDNDRTRKALLQGLGEDNIRTIITNVDGPKPGTKSPDKASEVSKQEPKLNKATFVRRYTKEVESYVVENILGKTPAESITFSGEFKERFTKTENDAREKAKTMRYSPKQTEILVQRALKEDVHKIMEDEASQKELLQQIDTEKLVVIATNVTNGMKTIDGKKEIKITQKELLKTTKQEEESRPIETFFSNAIDEIEKSSGIKIDKEKAIENIKASLDEIYVHKATGDAEPLEVVFGKKLGTIVEEGKEIRGKKLTEKRIEKLKEKYSLTTKQVEEISDKSKTEDEKYEALVRAVVHNDMNDQISKAEPTSFSRKQTEVIKDLSLEDKANLLSRALNMEGSVRRPMYTEEDMLKTIYGDKKEFSSEMRNQVQNLQITLKNLEVMQRAATETTLRLGLPTTDEVVNEMRKRIQTLE